MLYPSKLTRDDDSKNQTVFLLPKIQQFSTLFNQIPRKSKKDYFSIFFKNFLSKNFNSMWEIRSDDTHRFGIPPLHVFFSVIFGTSNFRI